MTAGGSEERIPRQFLVSALSSLAREIVKSLRPDVVHALSLSLSPLGSRLIARPRSSSSSLSFRNSVHESLSVPSTITSERGSLPEGNELS